MKSSFRKIIRVILAIFTVWAILNGLIFIRFCYAQEEEWVFLTRDSLGNEIYVNLKSIKPYPRGLFIGGLFIKNGAKVWTKTVFSEKGRQWEIKERKKEGLPIYYTLYKWVAYWIIDCDERKIGLVSAVYYDKNGKVLNSIEIPEILTEFRPVVPSSIGEGILDFVCEVIEKLK